MCACKCGGHEGEEIGVWEGAKGRRGERSGGGEGENRIDEQSREERSGAERGGELS